ncbi:MAG: hypothetical protein NTY65_12880 [Planctomycetota bacterium]|nr:hypothetical protein [Planctomycetota bacterium]
MHLETEEGGDIENPSEEQIRQAIRGLGGESGTFAILTRREEPLEYIQTSGEENAFVVERRENDRQFRAVDSRLGLEKTMALFLAYNRGGAWREMTSWEDVTQKSKGGEWTARIIIAVLVLITIAAVIVKFFL